MANMFLGCLCSIVFSSCNDLVVPRWRDKRDNGSPQFVGYASRTLPELLHNPFIQFSRFQISLIPRHKQRIWIDRAVMGINSVMQVRRPAFSIAGVADVADHIASLNEIV